ncbi:MAG: FAD-linked oxidase C-terminal domain-containing protein [Planctomycetia bacterium]|nr:FAD-linked oxidase C-terminal domain-containing protein [Planctomycetia bacterium]
MLNPKQERLQDDLRGRIRGDVLADASYVQPYATDASIFEIRPLAVVFPKTTIDIVETVLYAQEHKIPIHPRGAGSSWAGGPLGEGIVLDLSRYMRRILAVENNVLKVQAGAQCSWLNDFLQPHGYQIGSTSRIADARTVGGLLAVDGYGSHWLSGGRPSDWLQSVEIVTATGAVLSFGCDEPIPTEIGDATSPKGEKNRILRELARLLRGNDELLRKSSPRHVIDRMGYRMNILRDNRMNAARLIAGSEGTLGVITTVTLKLQKIPPYRKSALLLFESMEKATDSIDPILAFPPDACDLIDRRCLHLAMERDVRFDVMFPPSTEAVLLLDFSEAKEYDLMNLMRNVSDTLVYQKELASSMISAWDETESAMFWKLGNTLLPTTKRIPGRPFRTALVEDVAVPPRKLRLFILKAQELLRRHDLPAALSAHAAAGQVCVQPLVDWNRQADVRRLLQFGHEYYALVQEMEGTIGAENGIGLSRAGWLPAFLGERAPLCRSIKRLFDPESVFQPGKLGDFTEKTSPFTDHVPFLRSEFHPQKNTAETSENVLENFSPEPPSNDKPDRSGILVKEKVREILGDLFDDSADAETETEEYAPEAENDNENLPLTRLGLNWDDSGMTEIAFRCSGCGDCRGMERTRRTCPLFRLSHQEYATPRAKINLIHGLLNGKLELSELGDDAFHDVITQCFQCHSCRTECPSEVDIPFLIRRAQEAWASARGHNLYESSMARLDRWVEQFYHFIGFTNIWFTHPFMRWIMEKTFGIARQRKLPTMEYHAFLDQISRHEETAPPELAFFQENPGLEIHGKVVYFLDTFANHFDTSLARATIEVFQQNHIPIIVPQHQTGSGISAVSMGRSGTVAKQVARNAAILADYVRQGYDVVATEPTATLAFRWEFPQTFPDNGDIALVAKHTFDVGEYLYKLHLLQLLEMPQKEIPIRVGYHAPCRLLALKIGTPFANLLRLIPGMEVEHAPSGCCGMGGTYGLRAANYSASLRIGRHLHHWLRNPALSAGSTECTACQMQMEHNSTKPVLHPVKLLARAYGHMSELDAVLPADLHLRET